MIRTLHLTLDDPADNLALEERLLARAEQEGGPQVLRTWESAVPFVVLGLSCREEADVNLAACREDGVPVLRRKSGGGTVLQGPGSFSYALILHQDTDPALRSIGGANEWVLSRIADQLRLHDVPAEIRGISDLAVGGRKISGNAQRRKKDWILFHGTLLHGMPAEQIARYLRMPPRQPDYRADRAHQDFLTTLPLGPDKLVEILEAAFGAFSPLGL